MPVAPFMKFVGKRLVERQRSHGTVAGLREKRIRRAVGVVGAVPDHLRSIVLCARKTPAPSYRRRYSGWREAARGSSAESFPDSMSVSRST
jgi:hypothetical protein